MTTRLAVMAEKPSLLRHYRDVIADQNPTADLSDTPVFFPIMEWLNNTQHRYYLPRGYRWSDYPVISDHIYRDFTLDQTSFCLRKPLSDTDYTPVKDLLSKAKAAEKIIMLIDLDRSSIHPAQLFLRKIFGDNPEAEVHWVTSHSLAQENLLKNYETPLPAEYLSESFHRGEIHRYFDFNYIVNSLAINGETARRAGFFDVSLSKYGLQMLLHINPDGDHSYGEINSKAQSWEGTGKYDPKSLGNPMLGSPTSQWVILEQLTQLDLLEQASQGRFRVSESGKHFISLFHPRCKDSDLPFRLEEWSRMPMNEAKDKIGRYLRTFFGRQKRFLEKAS